MSYLDESDTPGSGYTSECHSLFGYVSRLSVMDDNGVPSTPYNVFDDDFGNLSDHISLQDNLGGILASEHEPHDRQWSTEMLYTSNAFYPAFLEERGLNDEGLYTGSSSTVEGGIVAREAAAAGFELHGSLSEWNLTSRYASDSERSRCQSKDSDDDFSEWSSDSDGEREAYVPKHQSPIASTGKRRVAPVEARRGAKATGRTTKARREAASKAKVTAKRNAVKRKQNHAIESDAEAEGPSVRPSKARRGLGCRLAQSHQARTTSTASVDQTVMSPASTPSPATIANTQEIKALPRKKKVIPATPAVYTQTVDASPAIASTSTTTAIPSNAATPMEPISGAEEIVQTEETLASVTALETPSTSVLTVALSNIATADTSPSQSHLSATPSPPLQPGEHEFVAEVTPVVVEKDVRVASSSTATAIPSHADTQVAPTASALAVPQPSAEQIIMAAAAKMSGEQLRALYADLFAMARGGEAAPSGTALANGSAPNQVAIQSGGHGTAVDSDLTNRTAHRANARAKESPEWNIAVACRWQSLNGDGNCGAAFTIGSLGTKKYLAHLMQVHSYVPQPKPTNGTGDKPKITCRWASTSRDGSVRACGQDLLEESLDRHLKATSWRHILSANPQATVTEHSVPGRRCPRCQKGHMSMECPS